MIGWRYTRSSDYAQAVENGRFDEDLDRMIEVLQRRQRIRNGAKVCPVCAGLLDEGEAHLHEGLTVSLRPENDWSAKRPVRHNHDQ